MIGISTKYMPGSRVTDLQCAMGSGPETPFYDYGGGGVRSGKAPLSSISILGFLNTFRCLGPPCIVLNLLP